VKVYQVTRKLQITIPKVIARELRIRPGDTVVFQKAGNALLVKKSRQVGDRADLVKTVEGFAGDMKKVGGYAANAETAMAANLSRHIST
jgi:AbrB family looped-hinge helix DNA binding protein